MDNVTLRILFGVLAVFEAILLAGTFVLLSQNKSVPDFIIAASASILTAILGVAIPHDASPQVNAAVAAAVTGNPNPPVGNLIPFPPPNTGA